MIAPTPAAPTDTLRDFYQRRFRAVYLCQPSEGHLRQFRDALDKWELLTRNPPLREITVEDLALFRDRLLGAESLDPATRAKFHGRYPGAATVKKHLRYLQMLFAKAGPPGPRNWDAMGIIDRVVYVRPPKVPRKLPRAVSPEILAQIYLAADTAWWPLVEGAAWRPPAWWRAIIVTAAATGYRRGALLALRWQDCDLIGRTLRLPPEEDKAGCERSKPVAEVVAKHLAKIQGPWERVFPWPNSLGTLHRQWKRIQRVAGLGGRNGMGPPLRFHDLKRFCIQQVARTSGIDVAQQFGDHASLETTTRYYANPRDRMTAAAEAMEWPEEFYRS